MDEGPPASSQVPYLPASDSAVLALFRLAPDGKALGEQWAEKMRSPFRKAAFLGGMGRKSLEGELVAHRLLEGLDINVNSDEHDPDSLDSMRVADIFEDWFAAWSPWCWGKPRRFLG